MEVNMIVALILSHQFEKAKNTWTSIQSKGVNHHPAIKGIGVFFILREKNYDKALQLLEGAKDINLIFLRSQVYMAAKKPY